MKYKTIPIYACIVIEWVNAKGKHTFAICRARCQIELDVSVFFRMWNCSNVNMISDLMNDLCCYCCHCCCCVMVCDDCCDYHTVEWDDRGSATDSIHNHIFVMLTITNVSHSFFFSTTMWIVVSLLASAVLGYTHRVHFSWIFNVPRLKLF